MMRRGLVAVAAVALIALFGTWLGGDALAASSKGPTLELSVILATKTDGGASIDPQLRDLPQLTRDQPFVKYNVYKLLDRKPFPLAVGKPITYAMVNGHTVQVTLASVATDKTEKRYQMEAQIGEPGKPAFLKSLQVTTSEGEPFFVGGQSYQGGTLFLELLVRP
jgi:hypothetical protein